MIRTRLVLSICFLLATIVGVHSLEVEEKKTTQIRGIGKGGDNNDEQETTEAPTWEPTTSGTGDEPTYLPTEAGLIDDDEDDFYDEDDEEDPN